MDQWIWDVKFFWVFILSAFYHASVPCVFIVWHLSLSIWKLVGLERTLLLTLRRRARDDALADAQGDLASDDEDSEAAEIPNAKVYPQSIEKLRQQNHMYLGVLLTRHDKDS